MPFQLSGKPCIVMDVAPGFHGGNAYENSSSPISATRRGSDSGAEPVANCAGDRLSGEADPLDHRLSGRRLGRYRVANLGAVADGTARPTDHYRKQAGRRHQYIAPGRDQFAARCYTMVYLGTSATVNP